MTMPARLHEALLHLFAIVAPVYAIFYPPLHDEPRSPVARRLWRSIVAGSLLYLVAGVAWIYR